MATVGWAAAVLIFLGGLFCVVEFVLDRIPSLTDRAVVAVRALRRLRYEITRGHDEGSHLEHGRHEIQESKPVKLSIESAEKEAPERDG